MSDNSNNVHFSGVRFICSPYLAIKSALASLLRPQNKHYCYILTMYTVSSESESRAAVKLSNIFGSADC